MFHASTTAGNNSPQRGPPGQLVRASRPVQAINEAAVPRGDLAVPHCDRIDAEPRTAEWPPDAGWHFRPGEAAFRGVVFAVDGNHQRLLQLLVSARRPWTMDDLHAGLYGDDPAHGGVERATVRGYLSELRRILRHAFGLPSAANPIPLSSRSPTSWRFDGDLLLTAKNQR